MLLNWPVHSFFLTMEQIELAPDLFGTHIESFSEK